VTVGEAARAGAEPRRPGAPLLQLADITVRFGTVTALAEAGMTVRAGTVHALLGENGAGKSTLMRVAFGMLRPQAGTITWRGAPVALPSPAAALALGVGMVHQHFSLVPEMTVAENVALGGRGRFDPTAAAARVREVAARAGLTLDPTARVRDLPVGAQQRCEIVKALARDVSLLILDEPTAVLAPSEAAELLAWVRGFADRGGAVVLITHKLRDALAVANDVTVLRRGVVQLQAARDEVTEDAVAAAMLGRAREGGEGTGALGVRRQKARDEDRNEDGDEDRDEDRNEDRGDAAALTLDAVTYTDAAGVQRVAHASLQLRGGEIVGVAAVEGSGQHELLRLMAGRLAPTTGQLRRPAATGFIPEDRHRDAVLLDAPLTENVALRGAATRRGLMRWDQVATDTAALMARHDVRAPGPDVPMRTLSGGNQQKLVLARELDGHPALLVAENPTRGLDFVATAAVHDALRAARANGVAVVLYSSDLDEVLALADRVVVMLGGRLQALDTTDRDLVGRAMLGSR
jgi:simple sugar transport system ATP-binding protein